MAIEPRVGGAALVRIASPATGSLVDFGYTRNQVDERYDASYLNVPGDQNGGDDGPPIEIQYMGEIATVRLELTSWEETTADLVRKRLPSATLGLPFTPGTLLFSSLEIFRLLILPTTGIRNFPRAIPSGAIQINKGTKFSSLLCEFECHKDATGVLFNTVTA